MTSASCRSSAARSSSPASRCSWPRRSGSARRSILAEYASPRVRRLVKPILEILAAIPSVVLGFFALTVLSPTLINPICPGPTPIFNMAAAGLAVGILITPLIASIAEDAMYAVPRLAARGVVRAGRAQARYQPAHRLPGRRLGHRCLAHRRVLARARRDDDRVDRRRRRWRRGASTSTRACPARR